MKSKYEALKEEIRAIESELVKAVTRTEEAYESTIIRLNEEKEELWEANRALRGKNLELENKLETIWETLEKLINNIQK